MSSSPWLDVTDVGVFARNPVTTRVGRLNWSSRADPSAGEGTFDNADGRWSPDNPTGPYHGQLGRNMPARIGVQSEGDAWVEWVESPAGKAVISTPHDASLDITGDIDIRVELEPTHDIRPFGYDGFAFLAGRQSGTAGWRLVALDFADTPQLLLTWWDSGGSVHNGYRPVDRDFYWTRRAYRVTLDVSTGELEWFTAPSISGVYTSIGTETQGATSIGTVNTPLLLGGADGSASIDGFKGRIYAFQLLDGIAGTTVADLDLTGQTPGATEVTDSEGLDWSVNDEGRITDTLWRVQGEVSSWPTRWTIPVDTDQWVPIEVNGQLRRLSQGRGVVRSALRRGIVREQLSTAVVGYWSMEDQGDQHIRRMGPAIGTKTLVRHGGSPNPGSNSDFLASNKIPTFDDDTWITNVDPHPKGNEWMVRVLFVADSDAGDDVDFLEVVTSDLVYLVRYQGSGNGDLRVLAYNLEGTNLHDSGYFDFNIVGRPVRLMLGVRQNGANLDLFCYTLDQGTNIEGGFSQTISSVGAGSVQRIRLNKNRDAGRSIAMGHLTVERVLRTGDLVDDLAAYDGETAAARIRRLCLEEGIDYRIYGDLDDATRMGPQPIATLVDLFQECADTDLGALYDSPERVAIGFRTGATIRNQDDVTFDYGAGELDGIPDLDRDDRDFANDITVVNWDGSEHRAQILTGRSSVFVPPSGAGRYENTYNINSDNPDALDDHANARLALHSAPEPRLSRLRLGLHLPAVDAAMRAQILGLRIGDRIVIQGLPSTIYPFDLPQIVQGWTETILPKVHWMDLVTTPASPWDTGVVEGTGPVVARYDTAGSELDADVTAGATSMSVATTLGPIWTTDSGDLPFDVLADGIRVTVTAISGSASPQTFTVTGATVVRDLAAGGTVVLADPTLYSL